MAERTLYMFGVQKKLSEVTFLGASDSAFEVLIMVDFIFHLYLGLSGTRTIPVSDILIQVGSMREV